MVKYNEKVQMIIIIIIFCCRKRCWQHRESKRSIHVWVFLCYNLEQCRICTITDVKECWCFWCWLFFVLQNLQKRIQIIVFCLGHVSLNLYVECRKFLTIQIYFDKMGIVATKMCKKYYFQESIEYDFVPTIFIFLVLVRLLT